MFGVRSRRCAALLTELALRGENLFIEPLVERRAGKPLDETTFDECPQSHHPRAELLAASSKNQHISEHGGAEMRFRFGTHWFRPFDGTFWVDSLECRTKPVVAIRVRTGAQPSPRGFERRREERG